MWHTDKPRGMPAAPVRAEDETLTTTRQRRPGCWLAVVLLALAGACALVLTAGASVWSTWLPYGYTRELCVGSGVSHSYYRRGTVLAWGPHPCRNPLPEGMDCGGDFTSDYLQQMYYDPRFVCHTIPWTPLLPQVGELPVGWQGGP